MYDSFLDPATGLLPADRVVAVIGNLGRPGLKFEQFSVLIQKIGFSLSDEQLKAIFLAVDLDQSFVMDASEAILGNLNVAPGSAGANPKLSWIIRLTVAWQAPMSGHPCCPPACDGMTRPR